MIKKILILGGEGNGGIIAACIKDMHDNFGYKDLEFCGFLNDKIEIGTIVNNYPVMGKTSDVNKFIEKGYYFIFAIHPIGHGDIRIKLFNKLKIPREKLLTIVHPSSFVAYNTILKPGVVIMPNCYIGTATIIRDSTIVLANSVISHNTNIGKLCHISAGSVVGSVITIGEASDVCLNATVIEKVNIGTCSVVGAGAVARNDIGDYEVHVGIPAKLLRKLK
ncbi:MAG TPA: sugar O-acyltransferase [Candidatus Atribacteria bacterium]|nr:sugar O-acyltransferase [Candidatus Atribacteria bacterium]